MIPACDHRATLGEARKKGGRSAGDARPDTVLVTGGGGFVGRHLVRGLIAAGMRVHATLNPAGERAGPPGVTGAELHRVDLRDHRAVASLFATVRPDYVFNLVCGRGESTPAERRATLDSTLGATASVIEAAVAVRIRRFIQVGSSTEYGPIEAPVSEAAALAPTTLFGAAKGAATLLCIAAARSGRLPAAVLRPFAVYGPEDRPHRLVPTAIEAAISGTELPLTRPGLRRDWVFVGDVVDACLAALRGGADGEVVNVATGVQHANEEVVDLVEHATGRTVRRRPGAEAARPWASTIWVADTRNAERLLGFRAATPLQRGLELTVSAEGANRATLATSP